MTKSKISRYHITAILGVIVVATIIMGAPLTATAAKSTTSGVHLQPRNTVLTVTPTSDGATLSQFTLAGLGQGTGQATFDVQGSFVVNCINPSEGNAPPGQREAAASGSASQGFTAQNGKATIGPITVHVQQPSQATIDNLCKQGQANPNGWTGSLGAFSVSSATLTVTFNGLVVFGPISL